MEKSVFLYEEGNTPKNRIWSFLIVHSEYDYSMREIARYSEVGYTTIKGIWKDFKKKKIVTQTRYVGKAKMYKLNLKNPVVNKFVEYYWAVVEAVVRRENTIREKDTVIHPSSADSMPVSAKSV